VLWWGCFVGCALASVLKRQALSDKPLSFHHAQVAGCGQGGAGKGVQTMGLVFKKTLVFRACVPFLKINTVD